LVNGYTGVYNAAAHGASLDHATGVGGVDLSSGINLGSTFTDVPGGTAHWTFAGGTNYNDQSGDVAIVISKADASVLVNGYTGVYDAAAHGASLDHATGVGGVDLSSGINLGLKFTDVPGGTAHWTFTGGTNYNDQSGDVAIVINQAPLTIKANDDTKTYDALAYTGGNGVTYSGFVGGETESVLGGTLVYSGSSQGAVNAGTYLITPSGLTSSNYTITFQDGTLTVNKATLIGIATTQDALNIAKQGSLVINISSIDGLKGADTVVDVFTHADFILRIGGHTYEYDPTVRVDSLTNTVYVTYTLRGGTAAGDALRADLLALDIADGGASTSAAKTPYSAIWVVAESTNYKFEDDFLTRLFSSAK
jgi:hypothetical protein